VLGLGQEEIVVGWLEGVKIWLGLADEAEEEEEEGGLGLGLGF
jgi:hypothetical protein